MNGSGKGLLPDGTKSLHEPVLTSELWSRGIHLRAMNLKIITTFHGAAIEVWEWISNFIPHFMMDVITYPC